MIPSSLELSLLTLAALCPPLQEPAKPAPTTPAVPEAHAATQPHAATDQNDAAWLDLDYVVMIVNQDIITWRQLLKQIKMWEGTNKPIANANEANRVKSLLLTDDVKRRLSQQAGQDMGLDSKIVEARVDENLKRMIEHENGVVGFSKLLEQRDMSTEDVRLIFREQLYSGVWKESVTGEGGGPQARPIRDLYIRPGLLRFYYMKMIDHPEAIEAIGGKPPMYTLQLLVVDPDLLGGMEKARQTLLQLRQRILDGEDMGGIVGSFGLATENKGILDPIDEARLTRVDPSAATFAKGAKPGDLSDVMTYKAHEGDKVFLRILLLLERTSAVKPDLASAKAQELIIKNARKEIEDYRLDAAYRLLIKGAYVWPPEFAGR